MRENRYEISNFVCPECGGTFPLPRGNNHKREKGHVISNIVNVNHIIYKDQLQIFNHSIKILFICILLLLLGTGCTTSITNRYPEIENDFLKSDYSQLKKLSNGESISYDELCQKYVESNLSENTYEIIDRIQNIGTLSNIKCKKTENTFTVSYDFKVDKNTTNISFVTDTDSFSLKNIHFNISTLKDTTTIGKLISAIESNDIGNLIYRNITTDYKIENKIYVEYGKYYYLPLENNEVRVYVSLSDINSSYQSSSTYFDKKIKDLEESLEKTEKLYGRP